jgi:hypothetical protein
MTELNVVWSMVGKEWRLAERQAEWRTEREAHTTAKAADTGIYPLIHVTLLCTMSCWMASALDNDPQNKIHMIPFNVVQVIQTSHAKTFWQTQTETVVLSATCMPVSCYGLLFNYLFNFLPSSVNTLHYHIPSHLKEISTEYSWGNRRRGKPKKEVARWRGRWFEEDWR